MINEFNLIVKALEDQRNASLTQAVQMYVEKNKLEERVKELEQENIELKEKLEGLKE